ncbi:MAG: F0F1 ATP synthase subunit delta [Pseudomonadota bacterium]|nr:F0F1 ATP synthase subunit delta [Pseudomonadota bacterium]
MELNWSTFVLEIINFLVLVWILKHFFYRPVLDVIVRRRSGIKKSLADAKALHDDAETLQAQYRDRLADWEQERQQARQQLAQEIEAERTQGLTALQLELEQESEKARVAEARRQADARHKIEETALIQASRFASRLLGQAATPELQAKLLELIVDQLPKLPAERITALRNSWGQAPEAIVVASAYPLSEHQRQTLQQVIEETTGSDLPLRFEQDTELLAGVRITIGAWVLGANLQDELKGFAEFAHATQQT